MMLEHRLVVTQTLLKETEDTAVKTLVEVAQKAREMTLLELADWMEHTAKKSYEQHARILNRTATKLRSIAA